MPLLILSLLCLLSPLLLSAQTGSVSGRVVDDVDGEAIPGATVGMMPVESTEAIFGDATDVDGFYRIVDLPSGTYRLVITSIGYDEYTLDSLVIEPGAELTRDIRLDEVDYLSDQIIVTASRREEKATRAPASTSVVTSEEIERKNALSTADYVREVGGLDVVQGGLSQNTVVARGFNNAFSGSLTTITDYRFAALPSLRYNGTYFIPLVNEDIRQIEVVRGPGSALYGPNASNGVLHMISRSPLVSSGTWLSIAGGERDMLQGMARHSGKIGEKVGYKISAQYMQGTDWGYNDPAEVQARADFIERSGILPGNVPDSVLIGARDSAMQRAGGEARLDWLIGNDARMTVTTGLTLAINNTDATGIGAAQARNWQYWYHQVRFRWKDLFAQAFLNRSDAGDTYALRTGLPIVDRSTVLVGQVQNISRFSETFDLTYGIDAILTTPVTDATVTGRNEEDDDITELGVYAQAQYNLLENLDIVGALRVDQHSRIDDPILSPRAAVVWSPTSSGSFRATYNRAYSAPSTNDLFLDVLAEQTDAFGIRAAGVPESGYTFRRDTDGSLLARSFFSPEPARYYRQDEMHLLWEGMKQAASGSDQVPAIFRSLIEGLPAPSAGVIGTELRVLDATTRAFEEFDGEIANRPQVRPTINNTIEIGWQGSLFDRVMLRVDLYRSHYEDFVGPLETITPSVFFESTTLRDYLYEVLREDATDTTIAAALADAVTAEIAGEVGNPDRLGVPVANITPEQAGDPTAVMLTYRNYGEITLYGYEIGLQGGITPQILLGGNMSYVDKNFLGNLDDIADLSLNAPKFKYNLSAAWRDKASTIDAALLFRHVDGFPVRSGVYSGNVPGYSTLSLEAGWQLPFLENAALRLSISNLLTWVDGADTGPFETRHHEFVGTPAIGRLGVLRATYRW